MHCKYTNIIMLMTNLHKTLYPPLCEHFWLMALQGKGNDGVSAPLTIHLKAKILLNRQVRFALVIYVLPVDLILLLSAHGNFFRIGVPRH